MSDPTPSTPKSQATEDAIVRGAPPMGFSILYHPVLDLLLNQHNSVIRTYLALCTMGNGGKLTKSVLTELHSRAQVPGVYEMTLQETEATLKKLREMGFVRVMSKANKPDEYYIMPFLPEEALEAAKSKVPAQEAQARRDEVVTKAAKQIFDATEVDVQFDPTTNTVTVDPSPGPLPPRQDQQPTAQRRNGDPLPSRHALSPWWQQHEDHQRFLDEVIKTYPKQVNRRYVMEAWEETFSNGPEMTQGEQHAVWQGLQRWMEIWLQEGTEDQYIPQLQNWIRKEKWLDPKVMDN